MPQEQVVQANVLLMMYRFYSWLAGKPLPLTEVHLQGPDRGNGREYESLFGCQVRFDQSSPGLVLPAPVQQLPVVQDEDSLRDYLRQTPYQLVRRDPPGIDRRLSDQVERILTSYASGAMPTARCGCARTAQCHGPREESRPGRQTARHPDGLPG